MQGAALRDARLFRREWMCRLGRLSHADVKRVFSAGKAGTNELGVMYVAPYGSTGVRFAVSAGRRFGKAVDRNRVKRCWREAFRLVRSQVRPGWDIVLVARLGSSGAGLETLKSALVDLCSRAGVLAGCDGDGERPCD